MATITSALQVLTQTYPSPGDLPSDRSAGIWGFVFFGMLVVGVVVLWRSLNKQLKRINFDEEPETHPEPVAQDGPRQVVDLTDHRPAPSAGTDDTKSS